MSRSDEMIAALDSALFSTFPDLNIKDLRIRSDNGPQLTLTKYENHIRTLGIDHETIHPHTPEEDAYIVSYVNGVYTYFDHFKEDYIYSREFNNFDEFGNYMDMAVKDYNSVRPPSSLNYLIQMNSKSVLL